MNIAAEVWACTPESQEDTPIAVVKGESQGCFDMSFHSVVMFASW